MRGPPLSMDPVGLCMLTLGNSLSYQRFIRVFVVPSFPFPFSTFESSLSNSYCSLFIYHISIPTFHFPLFSSHPSLFTSLLQLSSLYLCNLQGIPDLRAVGILRIAGNDMHAHISLRHAADGFCGFRELYNLTVYDYENDRILRS